MSAESMAERVIEDILPGLGEKVTSRSPDYVHLGPSAPPVQVDEAGKQR
ncbi:hypothetical protein [Ruania zhangjianzhongii]|nr:hypothetical protein [Ruania zhangjianzhongii]